MERGFFEERKLTTNEDASEILSDEDNKKIITFLNKETQRRLSPEYQNDAAEDFLELLEVLFSCLEKKGVSLE